MKITEELAQSIEQSIGGMELRNDEITVGFKKLSENAVIPTKAHESDSGFDLVASEDVFIELGETLIVPTDIAVDLPKGFEAQVRPRSGVTVKTGLRVQLGTIDGDYKGSLGVIVDCIKRSYQDNGAERINLTYLDGTESDMPSLSLGGYYIRKGDRIAQLVIQELPKVKSVVVTDIGESERGSGGFGSTGVE